MTEELWRTRGETARFDVPHCDTDAATGELFEGEQFGRESFVGAKVVEVLAIFLGELDEDCLRLRSKRLRSAYKAVDHVTAEKLYQLEFERLLTA